MEQWQSRMKLFMGDATLANSVDGLAKDALGPAVAAELQPHR